MEARLARIMNGRTFVALSALVFAIWVVGLARSHQLGGPPPHVTGDEPEYDNIAYQLWTRHRFALDYQDEGFLEPYTDARLPNGESYRESVAHRLSGVTTYRAPMFPVMMTIAFGIAGRNYAVIRLLNLLAAAVTLGITAWVCRRTIGAIGGLTAFVLLATLGHLDTYAALILTESLCAMFVALTLAALVLGVPRRPAWFAGVAGVLWAAAVLTRTGLVLWLPTVCVALFAIAWQAAATGKLAAVQPRWRRALTAPATFLLAFFLVSAPWMIRNSLVLHAFMPLGAQGYGALPTGFSDAAVASRGVWVKTDSTNRFSATTLPEYERDKARAGKADAMAWIRQHLRQLPALTVQKLKDEWRPGTLLATLMLLIALIGLICYRDTSLGLAAAAMIGGDLLMIASTWSVGGRFAFPAEPALYCLIAAGLWAMIRVATDLRGALMATESPVATSGSG